MAEIIQKIKSAFKSITSSNEVEEKQESGTMPFSMTGTEKSVKKVESEYEGFAKGFPEWNLEPPHLAVRRKK